MIAPQSGAATSEDAVLDGRLILRQPVRGHRVGHDALLLAASAPGNVRHGVDLGAGVGGAGLAFALRVAQALVTLVEIDPALAALAAENAARPALLGRAAAVCADIATLARPGGPAAPARGSADLVLMNPPFNDPTRRRASPDPDRARAHALPDPGIETWLKAADRLLEPGGRLALIHRPEALAALLEGLGRRFGAVTLRPVHARPGMPAIRLLVGAVKGRRTPPALLPGLHLAELDGRPSAAAEAVLRRGVAITQALGEAA
ncbi:MAG TPA: methyltransferase [Xanthobacteraceae bacterium]|nr:methyltransferase [Xanthobacteraceae bacterium]